MEKLNGVEPWVWVVFAVIAVLIILGVLAATLGKGKKRERDHSKAEAIRAEVQQDLTSLRDREASTLQAEAQAERSRAETDRLEAEAREQRHQVEDERNQLSERLREADEKDPLIDTNDGAHRGDDPQRRD